MQKSYIHTWFPRPLYIVEELITESQLNIIESRIRQIFDDKGWKSNGMLSVKSLHQTYDKLHFEPVFQPLCLEIMKHAKLFAKEYGYDSSVIDQLYFKNMWSNISHADDFNFPHVHNESLFSGAYYITAPSSAKIRFFNSIQTMLRIPKNLNSLSFEYCDYDCIRNNLILFRSDFLHGNERQLEGEKIVISFNISVSEGSNENN